MATVPSQRVQLVDPRTLYAAPPFDEQQPIEVPGPLSEMNPMPDHGEKSYRGDERLKGLSSTRSRSKATNPEDTCCRMRLANQLSRV